MIPLEVRGVDVYYGNTRIIKNISFNSTGGELIGIVGPNGSGKTTLLKTIGRLLRPRVGTVIIDQQEILSMKHKEFAKQVAAVPQDTQIEFEFKAIDIVLMGRNPHLGRLQMERPEDERIAKEAMRMTGCLHLMNRPIGELSGGERQRVIIARALAQEPRILLLDEPTSHLDINYQIETMDLLKSLSEKGLIVIAAIHDLNLAAQYCDRLIMLNSGEAIAIGKPEEVLSEERIREVFGCEVIVRHHPVTNAYYITPLPKRRTQPRRRGKKVHIICGGGSGASIMHELHDAGFHVSAGVLNLLDTDYEVAEKLGIEVITEAPFSPVSEESHQANLRAIERTDAVIIAPVAFGFGNLKNLDVCEVALDLGKQVFIMKDVLEPENDYTGGEAKKRIERLLEMSAAVVEGIDDLKKALEALHRCSDKRL
ncbi:MAG TPA: ATP-binding cassette domain-containing protein [Candidatus Syntrophoarchaeum butanivorans]|uniref:Cobalamin import ATP-binding protein BtuD n=1 Tax=Candidatus Syntropharchaeum butanivorans TaxID=1839936 RepID=A0A7C0X3F9_9EURY|nr:ATP-binding cassette domain-containing protein [Candidatus Syntrophoarchaeum butanivorans]